MGTRMANSVEVKPGQIWSVLESSLYKDEGDNSTYFIVIKEIKPFGLFDAPYAHFFYLDGYIDDDANGDDDSCSVDWLIRNGELESDT